MVGITYCMFVFSLPLPANVSLLLSDLNVSPLFHFLFVLICHLDKQITYKCLLLKLDSTLLKQEVSKLSIITSKVHFLWESHTCKAWLKLHKSYGTLKIGIKKRSTFILVHFLSVLSTRCVISSIYAPYILTKKPKTKQNQKKSAVTCNARTANFT